jgi:lysozyme family protein
VIIPEERTHAIYKRVSSESFNDSPVAILKKVGMELDADWVVAGYVYCYKERKGFTYAVKQPASVSFCAHLLRVEDGRLIWKHIFNKTQASLMENLLDVSSFVQGRGGWLTAEELTRQGVGSMLQTFPGLH